jgi:hypothetical protein
MSRHDVCVGPSPGTLSVDRRSNASGQTRRFPAMGLVITIIVIVLAVIGLLAVLRGRA